MDRLSKLVTGVSLFFLVSISHAGYAQLSPPSFWSPTPVGGSVGTFNVGAAANDAIISNGAVRTNAALNVGGRAIQVPVSMRLAANASKISAAAIYLNPYLRTASAIASWLAAAGIVYSVADNVWQRVYSKDEHLIPGYTFVGGFGRQRNDYSLAVQDAKEVVTSNRPSWTYTFSDVALTPADYAKGSVDIPYITIEPGGVPAHGSVSVSIIKAKCPDGWTSTPAGCLSPASEVRKINEESEFSSLLDSSPMPSGVPVEVPVHLPVEVPQINPQPDPSPFFVPTGDPVPNPSFDPAKAPSPQNAPQIQPGTRVKPANDPLDPWRVDVAPVDKPVLDPNADPDRNPDFGSKPNGETPSKNPEQSDLCDKHPDILACATSGDNQDEPIKEKRIDIDLSPDSGWGAGSAACPAPKVINPQGRQILIPYDLFCTYSQGMRPIILAMAWLSAAFILLGFKES